LSPRRYLPVYVERKWQGKSGSISWWLPVKMDEAERTWKRRLRFLIRQMEKQMYRVCVFDDWVYDADPTSQRADRRDWTVCASISAAPSKKTKNTRPEKLVKCDRVLFEKIQALNALTH